MRDLYGDDYESVAGDGATRLLPEGARRIAGAIVFLGLVAVMGIWAWRLGTRDAAEVPVIRAMAGPSRVEPEDPGGLQGRAPGARGQRRARRAAGAGAAGRAGGAAGARGAGRRGRAAGRAGAGGAGDAGRAGAERGRRAADARGGGGGARAGRRGRGAGAGRRLRRRRSRRARGAGGCRAAADEPAAQPRRRPGKTEPVAAPAKPRPAAATAAAPAVREVSSARPGTRMVQLGAYDSEEMTRRAWSRLVAANPRPAGVEEPLRRADDLERAGVLPAAGRRASRTPSRRG